MIVVGSFSLARLTIGKKGARPKSWLSFWGSFFRLAGQLFSLFLPPLLSAKLDAKQAANVVELRRPSCGSATVAPS